MRSSIEPLRRSVKQSGVLRSIPTRRARARTRTRSGTHVPSRLRTRARIPPRSRARARDMAKRAADRARAHFEEGSFRRAQRSQNSEPGKPYPLHLRRCEMRLDERITEAMSSVHAPDDFAQRVLERTDESRRSARRPGFGAAARRGSAWSLRAVAVMAAAIVTLTGGAAYAVATSSTNTPHVKALEA